MKLEKLGVGLYNDNNQDFTAVDDLWEPIETELAKKFVESNKKTLEMTRKDEDLSMYTWEAAQQTLADGRVIELMMMFVRQQTDLPKCPLCGSNIEDGLGAISRRDNVTEICSV